VIQKALSIAKEPFFTTLIKVNSMINLQLIAPHMEKLKKMAFGLKLYNKLVSLYPELLERAPADQVKKKITINLGPSVQSNVNKKRIQPQNKQIYNNFEK
jgi:hypothetical protein